MRFLVYGAGVQGTVFATRLAHAGHDVAVLARGDRLTEIREHGLVLEEFGSGTRSYASAQVTERLLSTDAFDVALVTVRRDQIDSVLPELASATGVRTICFMHNHAGGSATLADAVGSSRAVLGFPGVSGYRRPGGAVVYSLVPPQPTTLGEVRGSSTARLAELRDAFRSAGFPTVISRCMDAWLNAHAIFITAMCGALYRHDGFAIELATDRQCVGLLVRAVREGFASLPPSLMKPPSNLRTIFSNLPLSFGVKYWRWYLGRPVADLYFGRHARASAVEMRALVDDLRALLPAAARAPSLRQLWRDVDAFALLGSARPGGRESTYPA